MNYNTKYVVRLSAEEREGLRTLANSGKVAAGKRRRSQILLSADAGPEGSGPTDKEVAEALDVGIATVHRVRQAFVDEGCEAAVQGCCQGRPRPSSSFFGRRRIVPSFNTMSQSTRA